MEYLVTMRHPCPGTSGPTMPLAPHPSDPAMVNG